jgi:hypothetical protein
MVGLAHRVFRTAGQAGSGTSPDILIVSYDKEEGNRFDLPWSGPTHWPCALHGARR